MSIAQQCLFIRQEVDLHYDRVVSAKSLGVTQSSLQSTILHKHPLLFYKKQLVTAISVTMT